MVINNVYLLSKSNITQILNTFKKTKPLINLFTLMNILFRIPFKQYSKPKKKT